MIKLIACDLDGTVFDDDKNIDSDLKEVVDKLKEKGILFTVVSGRNEELMLNVIDHFKLDLPYVCNNGANIYKNHELIHLDCIPVPYADKAARLLFENDIVFRAYTVEDTFCNKISDFFLARMKGFSKPFQDYDPEIDLNDYHTVKITSDFTGHEDKVEKLQSIIKAFPGTDFFKAEPNVYCVNSLKANKGDGLKWVCDYLNIDMANEVMAFGDNENDLPMLTKVNVSVAVGNSEDTVKQQVDYVCDDNNHNGVSKFLKEYFKDLL